MDPSGLPSESVYLLVLIALLLCSMFFSASETAFMSLNRLHIRYLTEKKNRAAIRVEKLLKRKTRFLNTILVGNNAVNIAISSLVTAVAIQTAGDAGVGIATAIATVGILVFGDIFPKSVALMRPEKLALKVSLFVSILVVVASPLVFALSVITGALSFLLGARKKTFAEDVTEEDLKAMIETGEEEGLIESRERDMMRKILNYADLNTRDIMTPRTDIVSIGIDATRREILALSRKSSLSRFPVCGDDIDDIRGILYIKDFLFAPDAPDNDFSVRDLLRPALFIFETQRISAVQKKLRAENQNIAVVIDEYGGVSGLVTIEDLVEEIFGGIRDEYDRIEPAKSRRGDGDKTTTDTLVVTGAERIDDINERLSLHLNSRFYDTIGGFVMERHGDIPAVGTEVSEQGFRFTVLGINGNRIGTVKITRIEGSR